MHWRARYLEAVTKTKDYIVKAHESCNLVQYTIYAARSTINSAMAPPGWLYQVSAAGEIRAEGRLDVLLVRVEDDACFYADDRQQRHAQGVLG